MKEEYAQCLNSSSCDVMACCPVDNTFKIIGKKFTIHILRNMGLLNQRRFNQLLESIEGINPKTLSVRLREMEKNGLIARKIFPDTPPRVEYSITKKGLALKPVILAMAAFSMKHCAKDIFKDGKSRTLKQVFNPTIIDIPKEHRR